ncbi:hypothetical protein [Algoriphagus boritolerans]|uniref:hypothetical protein n=1 Tax=Algoriphagus boritolerans TaxID=308111 RepID=UPI002FCE2AB0
MEQIIRRILEDYDFGGDFMDKEKDVEFLVEGVKKSHSYPLPSGSRHENPTFKTRLLPE